MYKIDYLCLSVKNFSFEAKNYCLIHSSIKPGIKLSFFLEGYFEKACISDEISDSADYQKICDNIEKAINKGFFCENASNYSLIEKIFPKSSKLISKTYLSLEISCQSIINKTMPLSKLAKINGGCND